MAYASRTGTRRNLAALRDAGWRLMVSARGVLRTEGFRYSLDNGAWTAFQRGEPFDVDAFEAALALLGDDADFVVAPDVVLGGLDSLRFSESWLPRLERYRLVLVPVQNGMAPDDVRGLLGARVGIFVGGDAEWKERSLPMWARLAGELGCHLHVGRVNTVRRIKVCAIAGVDSIDGSSVSRFACNLPRLDAARRQTAMEWDR